MDPEGTAEPMTAAVERAVAATAEPVATAVEREVAAALCALAGPRRSSIVVCLWTPALVPRALASATRACFVTTTPTDARTGARADRRHPGPHPLAPGAHVLLTEPSAWPFQPGFISHVVAGPAPAGELGRALGTLAGLLAPGARVVVAVNPAAGQPTDAVVVLRAAGLLPVSQVAGVLGGLSVAVGTRSIEG